MSHNLRVRPVRVSHYDGDQRVHVSRIVGYRLCCSCGWRSPARRRVSELRELRQAHAPRGAPGAARPGGT